MSQDSIFTFKRIDEQNGSKHQHNSTFVVIGFYLGFKPPFLRLVLREFKRKNRWRFGWTSLVRSSKWRPRHSPEADFNKIYDKPAYKTKKAVTDTNNVQQSMVSEMVQNSQSLYSFTFTAVIVIHEYIYSHSTTKFTFKKYICLHLRTYFLFRNIFTHIYGMYRSHSTAHIRSHSRSKYSFNTVQYSFNIFYALPLRIVRSQLRLFLNANGRRRRA